MAELVNEEKIQQARVNQKKERRKILMRRIMNSKMAVTGLVIILIALVISLLSPIIVSHSPLEMNTANRLQPPNADHWFGTDNFGRDVFSRVVYGVRASMLVGFAVTVIASIVGTIVGLYAAYYSWLDHVLMRICDGLMSFPSVLLAIALVAALGPKLINVIIALSVVFFPSIARVVRAAALVVREQTYIEALKSMGASSRRIIWLHIAPNTTSPLIVQATFIFAITLIIEAMLSFLGAGVPAPFPSLGNILFDGKNVITTAWWMTVFPGAAIISIVLALNLFGDGLRDFLDPHTKHF